MRVKLPPPEQMPVKKLAALREMMEIAKYGAERVAAQKEKQK